MRVNFKYAKETNNMQVLKLVLAIWTECQGRIYYTCILYIRPWNVRLKKKIIMQEYFFSLHYHSIFDADNILKILNASKDRKEN